MPRGDDGKGQQCLPFGPGPFRIRQGQHQQRSFSRHSCANVLVQFLRFIRIYRIWSTQRWCVNLHKSHRFSWNEMKSCHVVKGRRRDSDAREAGYLQMHCQRESSSLIGTLEYIENMNMTSMTMTMFWIIFWKVSLCFPVWAKSEFACIEPLKDHVCKHFRGMIQWYWYNLRVWSTKSFFSSS